MHKFEVKIKRKVVWSGEFKNASARHFPDEYLARPEEGEVHLFIDGECVGVQIPLADADERDANLRAEALAESLAALGVDGIDVEKVREAINASKVKGN